MMNNTSQMILEIIKKIEYFPQQVGTPYHVLQRLKEPEISLQDFLNTLEFDISITTNILTVCNTPLYLKRYAIPAKVGSLKEAAQYIPLEELKRIMCLRATNDIFAHTKGIGYESDKGQIRRHSIASAVISKYLLPFAPPLPADLFTACLLHDVGKMILDEYIANSHGTINQLISGSGIDFSEAEERVIGLTHAEVGARILEKWQFPEEMVKAVRFHHLPEKAPDSPMAHFVSLANVMAIMMGFATDIDGMEYKGFPALYKQYNMKEKHLEEILMHSLDEVKRAIPYDPPEE